MLSLHFTKFQPPERSLDSWTTIWTFTLPTAPAPFRFLFFCSHQIFFKSLYFNRITHLFPIEIDIITNISRLSYSSLEWPVQHLLLPIPTFSHTWLVFLSLLLLTITIHQKFFPPVILGICCRWTQRPSLQYRCNLQVGVILDILNYYHHQCNVNIVIIIQHYYHH